MAYDMNVIRFNFHNATDRFRFLSNFYLCTVTFQGRDYPSSEHAFQAAKTYDLSSKEMIRRATSPGDAKRMGRRARLRKDWEAVKIDVMRDVVRAKFSNPELGDRLLDTGDAELVEDAPWGDTFWGVTNGKGLNWLGKILMEVREELKVMSNDRA